MSSRLARHKTKHMQRKNLALDQRILSQYEALRWLRTSYFWVHLLFALYYLNYLIEGLVEDGKCSACQLRHQPQQHDLGNHEHCCEDILTYSLVYS